jgi:hypothetical protein
MELNPELNISTFSKEVAIIPTQASLELYRGAYSVATTAVIPTYANSSRICANNKALL